MGDSYASLLERLETPQAAMQRFAVIAIFDKLKSAPSHLSLQSEAGREALFYCLHSSHAAVVDQAVRQLCSLVQEGFMAPPQAFQELQAAMDASPPHSVETITKAIGFLSRLLYKNRSPHISTIFSSPEHHPFVKVFVSRVEAHVELLEQLIFFIAEGNFINSTDLLEFLRPMLTFSVVQISISTAHTCFARRLHSHLASLSCTHSSQGLSIFRILVECIKYYPQRTAQEIGMTIAAAEELVDAFEIILKKSIGDEKEEQARVCGIELSESLMALCIELSEHGFGSSPALVLLKRSILAHKEHDQDCFYDFNSMLASLAHMLAAAEYEHEQLLLLTLSTIFLEWKMKSGVPFLQAAVSDFPIEVILIFPVIHVMSSPSKAVKKAAVNLLLVLERKLDKLCTMASSSPTVSQTGLSYSHKHGIVLHRLLQYMWSQDQGLTTWNYHSQSACQWFSDLLCNKNRSKVWLEHLGQASMKTCEGSKSIFASQPYGRLKKGVVLLLSMVVSALVIHPHLGSSATEALAAIGRSEPTLGVSLLPVVLFYLKILRQYGCKSEDLVLELLGVLPSLACHSVTVPFIIQTLQPMLHEDAKPKLRATAIRLLCRSWEFTDRVFDHLQRALQPKAFSTTLETDLVISMAASVRDVCRKDADRGVDLILSIQACIESKHSTVQALGLESLAHLCQADVIDFYTAWVVISKYLPDILSDPIIANSLCIFLRWGAMDAEAYPEASKRVLELIWQAATYRDPEHSDIWLKARISSIQALTFYEVGYVQQCIAGFHGKAIDLLLSELTPEVQQITEELVVRFLIHEHKTRRRLRKQDRVGMSKVEKLMHALPQILFSSDVKGNTIADFPGAALLCLTFSPPARAVQKKVFLRDLQKWQAKHENALMEIAGSMQLSRNIFVALLSLQSWLSFIRRWLRAKIMVFEAEDVSDMHDKIAIKAADSIFKDISKLAEEAVPRVAENLALALGALCMVLPSSAHCVTPFISKFLLNWMHQDGHEYKQWSAAISLGLVSTCLHATDWKHKYEIINGLLKVAGSSGRALVTGACGVALGFACQDLLSCETISDASDHEMETGKQKEAALLAQIVRTLMQLLCQLCPCVSESLQNLNQFRLPSTGGCNAEYKLADCVGKQCEEENVWGIAGLVIGLGNSIVGIQRAGNPTLAVEITKTLISWIPCVNSWQGRNSQTGLYASDDISAVSLAVGSCLALSTAVSICHKMELMDEGLDTLVNGFRSLISEVECQKDKSYSNQNLLMAACIGAGELLSCILNEGAYPIKFEDIKNLLETIRKTYTHPNPPIVHFGGMIGVVNAMNACVGIITQISQQTLELEPRTKHKEASYVRGPILSNPVCEPLSLLLIQEILGVVRDSKDVQLGSSAGWALSFLRNAYLHRDQSLHQAINGVQTDTSRQHHSSVSSQSFPEDSTVLQLCSIFSDTGVYEAGSPAPANKIVSVLRCLEKAPRLPALDWGGIIRRLMRYKDHNQRCADSCAVREECVHFSFVHAENIPPLLIFLDELCEPSRFRLLKCSLQSILLLHMVDMARIFSQSRMEKFFNDIMEFFNGQLVSKVPDQDTDKDGGVGNSLEITFWKSLYKCLVSAHALEKYLHHILKCMERLFHLLPSLPSKFSEVCKTENRWSLDEEVWSEAIKCFMNSPKAWLLDILQIKAKESAETEEVTVTVKKVILARTRLVANNYIPPSELGKARSCLLNEKSSDIWRLLMEVAAALRHTTIDVKRQWLLDTIETSCITQYPSTALRFLGLLTSSWSPQGSCLILDPMSVLQDLPLTLPSLFLDSNWRPIFDSVVQKLLSLIERIHTWLASLEKGDCTNASISIDRCEKQVCSFLLDVMQQTCIAIRHHLPLDAQFKVVNMRIV
eukprot:Gb_07737 [translate_table: standard]